MWLVAISKTLLRCVFFLYEAPLRTKSKLNLRLRNLYTRQCERFSEVQWLKKYLTSSSFKGLFVKEAVLFTLVNYVFYTPSIDHGTFSWRFCHTVCVRRRETGSFIGDDVMLKDVRVGISIDGTGNWHFNSNSIGRREVAHSSPYRCVPLHGTI